MSLIVLAEDSAATLQCAQNRCCDHDAHSTNSYLDTVANVTSSGEKLHML